MPFLIFMLGIAVICAINFYEDRRNALGQKKRDLKNKMIEAVQNNRKQELQQALDKMAEINRKLVRRRT